LGDPGARHKLSASKQASEWEPNFAPLIRFFVVSLVQMNGLTRLKILQFGRDLAIVIFGEAF